MKETNKQLVRIMIGIIAGIILSVLVNTVLISVGYASINMHNLTEYTVKFINIPVFYIKEGGEKGIANPSNMMMLGIVWSVITVFFIETVYYLKEKKERGKK